MRTILITVMLIITAIILYNNNIGGANGTKAIIRESGGTINATIQSINP